MLLTIRLVVPVLAIVIGRWAKLPTWTLPKARLPLTPMMDVGAAVPVPDAAMVLVPLVASLVTVTVPE